VALKGSSSCALAGLTRVDSPACGAAATTGVGGEASRGGDASVEAPPPAAAAPAGALAVLTRLPAELGRDRGRARFADRMVVLPLRCCKSAAASSNPEATASRALARAAAGDRPNAAAADEVVDGEAAVVRASTEARAGGGLRPLATRRGGGEGPGDSNKACGLDLDQDCIIKAAACASLAEARSNSRGCLVLCGVMCDEASPPVDGLLSRAVPTCAAHAGEK